jgi:Zn-dependent M28 family amino/carboxypeptidase
MLSFFLLLATALNTSFNANAIRAHVKFLSSDLLEGRGPGTRGDALAQSYIATQFESYGLETSLQKVALLGITPDASKTEVAFTKDGQTVAGPLKFLDDFVGGDQTQGTQSTLDSEVVFVGHGVVAPEYKWDDYKGLDTRGKTLVMLVDDPPATASEPDLFKGRARTYYGRWTYKYEIGTAKGAQGVILIHTNDAAGYGWQVVRNSWSGEQAYVRKPADAHGLSIAAWITESVAQNLFRASGQDLAALTKAAASRDFKPVPLGIRIQGHIGSTLRSFETANVIAKLEGSDPQLKNEAVLYSAHHDHLGIGAADPADPTDHIYNGALDNASGVATLLELARVWSSTTPRPKRSIYFAAVAAEEQGLLGSRYLAEHPPIPIANVVLGINVDELYFFGDVKSVSMIGVERTTFFPTAQAVTKELGLTIVPDPAPEQGSYYRSDHFSFGKAGVPAFTIKQVPGDDAQRAFHADFKAKRYHQPGDQFDPSWNFASANQVATLAFRLGEEAANAAQKAAWLPGDEFARKSP